MANIDEKVKRKTCSLYPPIMFFGEGCKCPKCGSRKVTWSEYQSYLYCYSCDSDFKVPRENDFIPMQVAAIMGIRTDIIDLANKKIIWADDLPRPWEGEWLEIEKQSRESMSGANEFNFSIIRNVVSRLPILFFNGDCDVFGG